MDEYVINMNEILNNTDTYASIKQLFRMIKENTYVTPEQYFQTQSSVDLEVLQDLVETMNDPDATDDQQFAAQEQLMLMTIGFLVGEGVEISEDTVTEGIRLTILMVTLENLARKGLVKVHRQNWCMTGDPDKAWVERI